MLVRRNLVLAWLAVTLTALAPVLAYAHIHVGANGEIVEHCAAEEPGDGDAGHDRPDSDKGTAPHCPYCPGFAAGAAMAWGAASPALPVAAAAATVRAPHAACVGRASLRIAQQRGPPSRT